MSNVGIAVRLAGSQIGIVQEDLKREVIVQVGKDRRRIPKSRISGLGTATPHEIEDPVDSSGLYNTGFSDQPPPKFFVVPFATPEQRIIVDSIEDARTAASNNPSCPVMILSGHSGSVKVVEAWWFGRECLGTRTINMGINK